MGIACMQSVLCHLFFFSENYENMLQLINSNLKSKVTRVILKIMRVVEYLVNHDT